MMIDEEQLRKELTRAMAEAVDEADSFEDYFGDISENADFGVARADGVMPADLLFLWNYAGQLVDYVANYGLDAMDIAERAGNIFVAYQAIKSIRSDFTDDEKVKIPKAAAETLSIVIDDKK